MLIIPALNGGQNLGVFVQALFNQSEYPCGEAFNPVKMGSMFDDC